jgi:hypothetical protein
MLLNFYDPLGCWSESLLTCGYHIAKLGRKFWHCTLGAEIFTCLVHFDHTFFLLEQTWTRNSDMWKFKKISSLLCEGNLESIFFIRRKWLVQWDLNLKVGSSIPSEVIFFFFTKFKTVIPTYPCQVQHPLFQELAPFWYWLRSIYLRLPVTDGFFSCT